ncbi:hypothetical protein [Streptomyces sp. NPDC058953]|uniref:hypothetical protein n=1 Tax=unclassified Streptomyces TaxID=2593676 RepID=UPI0036C7BBE1
MSRMGAGSALRLAHTAVLAAVCVVVSGAGHTLASGTSPPPTSYAVAVPPVCLLAWHLTRKERSAGAVVSVSALTQAALHLLFGLFPHGAPGGGKPAHHASAPGPASGVVDPAALLPGLFSTMTAAHAVAGAVCGWWLWRGERALAQLALALDLFAGDRLRFAWTVLRGAYTTPVPRVVRPQRARERRVRLPASLLLLRAVTRRGPPLLPS